MKSTNQETNLARGALLPPQRSAASSGDQLQIDIGDYEIFVGDQKVGEVWVEPITEAPGDTVEHWCLLSNYVQPSEHSPVVSLQFRFASGLHASFDDFIRYVRAQSGARYIKATCCEQAP